MEPFRVRVSVLLARSGATVFLAAAVMVGVVVGVAAALLIEGLAVAADLIGRGGRAIGHARLVLFLTIPAGFVAAWWLARRFSPSVAGDGVPETRVALALNSGAIPGRTGPLKMLVTILTLGSGGSAGREGPIVLIGGSIGSSLARGAGLGEDRVRSLVAAGAGAAIGASFNAPIAGMLFAMEVILGNFAVRHLNAVVVSSVPAAVTTRTLVGEELILRAFPFRLNHPRDLLLYALLGVVSALGAWLFLRLVDVASHRQIGGKAWARPLIAGIVVAAVAFVSPEVAGTGQDYVRGLLGLLTADSVVWYVLGGIAVAKAVATAATLGSGASGGAFMPSLFIGAAVGAGFADLASTLWPGSGLQPGAFAVVGMAATFAAVARAPLTSILIVFELTQDYGLVLPLMLATSLATYLADRVHPLSVYSLALARSGITLTPRSEVDLLDTVTVGEVVARDPVAVSPTTPAVEAASVMEASRLHGVPVVDAGLLVGLITVTDLARAREGATVGEVMTRQPTTAIPATPVSQVVVRMAALDVGRVPIVADDGTGRLVGVFRREDVVRAYRIALGQEIDHDLGRSRLQARTASDTDFHSVIVPAGSVADGQALRHVAIPADSTIVSVRRGTDVVVPDGNTQLLAGDVLTVFSRGGGHLRLFDRLSAEDTAEMDVIVGGDIPRFADIEIPLGSPADTRAVRDIDVPIDCTIVSLQRQSTVIVPNGSTVIQAGDRITVFARPESRRQFVDSLQPPTRGQ